MVSNPKLQADSDFLVVGSDPLQWPESLCLIHRDSLENFRILLQIKLPYLFGYTAKNSSDK